MYICDDIAYIYETIQSLGSGEAKVQFSPAVF